MLDAFALGTLARASLLLAGLIVCCSAITLKFVAVKPLRLRVEAPDQDPDGIRGLLANSVRYSDREALRVAEAGSGTS